MRYDDVTQDGRVRLETLTVSLGVIWRQLLVSSEIREGLLAQGIIPILTRFQLEGTPGPFAIDPPLEVHGGYALTHAADENGTVTRLMLDMDAEVWGPKGRTNLPPPDDAGTRAFAGRLRAEHVFTRPFASPADRKVLAIEIGGKPLDPGARRAWMPATSALVPPKTARALEPELTLDPTTTALGVTHTDSNQHVNSLVYPRLFEEAALRRIAALGRSSSVLARTLDIGFRRPSFAGENLRVSLQAFEDGARIVCVGAFFGDGESDLTRARAYVQMAFE